MSALSFSVPPPESIGIHTVMYRVLIAAMILALATPALADGIVARIVPSPLSATGLVAGAPVALTIELQSKAAPGYRFMDPHVVGYGVPAGGRIEVTLVSGFERIADVPLTIDSFMAMTGAAQQGLHGKAIGYQITEGETRETYVLTPTRPEGLIAEQLRSPAVRPKKGRVDQRGIKRFHVGLLKSAFRNAGPAGRIEVRILDSTGAIVHSGTVTVPFLDRAVPQIFANNFPHGRRAHDWQTVKPGAVLGVTPGTLPLPVMLFAAARDMAPADMGQFRTGIADAGVVSVREIQLSGFQVPEVLSRYNGGLILQDTDRDGRLTPGRDRIIGGVLGKGPPGASGMLVRSSRFHGAAHFSRPSTAYHEKFGAIFGGSVALLEFTAGNKPGLYRPTFALLSDPDDPASPDGARVTYTIRVR